MTLLRMISTLGHDSQVPQDSAVNVLHFSTTDLTTSNLDDIRDAWRNFLEPPTGTQPADYLSSNLSGAIDIRFYDMEDAEPRVPIYQWNDVVGPGTTALPEELALCVSFQGTPTSGTIPARRRGRFFFGPLAQNALGAGAAANRPASALITALATQCDILAAQPGAFDGDWVVYSPRTGPPDDPSARILITNGWVDNAFDVQRRRGVSPTTRTTWTIL